jgi:hypothetical protein
MHELPPGIPIPARLAGKPMPRNQPALNPRQIFRDSFLPAVRRLPLVRTTGFALLLGVLTLGCQVVRVDEEYRRVWNAAESVMLTDGPWVPEFLDGRTLFLRPGSGLYFRGAREPVRWGYGDGWDWEAYSLGKDAAGVEVWFWSSTRITGTRREETPAGTDWGISLVEHGDGGSTMTLERVMPEFEMEPRSARDRSSERAYIRVLSRAGEERAYWDDAVIVWTREGQTAQQPERPFRAAHVRRDAATGELVVGRVEVSLGEVIGNPPWEMGRRIRF